MPRREAKDKAAEAAPAPAPEAASVPPATEAKTRQRSRCSNCGFVAAGNGRAKPCPACGGGPEGFQPFDEKMSQKRARLLALRLHPMAAHAAPAFAAALLALAAVLAAAGPAAGISAGTVAAEDAAAAAVPLGAVLIDAVRTLAVLLPIAIVAAFLTGLADARLRLKKGTTPLLVKKMITSAIFLALSFATAALALFTSLEAPVLAPFAVLAALEAACALYLGRKGSALSATAVAD